MNLKKTKFIMQKIPGFEPITEDIYNFMVGGYQGCKQVASNIRRRTLSREERMTYIRIITSIKQTITLMNEIDELIEKSGGFPLE
ncbi:MAG: hypothetical protein R2883_05010 [Caldisericia bacterium]